MELVLPMYNVHSYISLKNLVKTVCIIHGKIGYVKVGESKTGKSLGLDKK